MSSTDLVIPALGYGAANVGNLHRALDDDEADAVLEAAWDAGIRYFDTAPHYGLGLSERRLGAFLQTKPRDEFVLSTKVGRLLRPNPRDDGGLDLKNSFHVRTSLRREWDFSGAGIRASISESLERMGLDRVDIAYLHDPERHHLSLALDEALPALEEARAAGLVRGIGIGSMVSEAITACVNSADLDAVMIAGRYTLLEQPASAEALPACRDRGVAVVAASVFNSGLLSSPQPDRTGRYEYGDVPTALWDRLQRILERCTAYEVPLPAAALQFPLHAGACRSVVVGGSKPAQLTQNAQYARAEIPAEFWHDVATAGLIPA